MSSTDSSKLCIPQPRLIFPAYFLFISYKNLPFGRTNLKIQQGFFKLFVIVRLQKPQSTRNKTTLERPD